MRIVDVQMAINRAHEPSKLAQNQLLSASNQLKDRADILDKELEAKLKTVKGKDEVVKRTVRGEEERERGGRGRQKKDSDKDNREKNDKKGIDLTI